MRTADVKFRSDDPNAGAPDPAFLRIHAAFGRVLHICGAVEYMDKVEILADSDIPLVPGDELGFTSCLSAKLELLTY